MTSTDSHTLAAITGAAAGAAAAYFLFKKTTKKTTHIHLTINNVPPTKVISTLKNRDAPYALDASSPLLPLPASLGCSYLNTKVLDLLRVEGAKYAGDGTHAKLSFKSAGCECELVYSAKEATQGGGKSTAVDLELTADGPMGTAYLVTGLGLAQALVRLLLLKVKMELSATKAAAADAKV